MQQGVDLMLFGMLTVVLFLGLLVIAVGAMSSLVARFGPAPAAQAPAPAASAPRDGPDPAVVAAITAAIALHRARRRPGGRYKEHR